MKKEHSVFIFVNGDELCNMINQEARRKGFLKDVKSTVGYELFDAASEVSIKYKWTEEIK